MGVFETQTQNTRQYGANLRLLKNGKKNENVRFFSL